MKSILEDKATRSSHSISLYEKETEQLYCRIPNWDKLRTSELANMLLLALLSATTNGESKTFRSKTEVSLHPLP